eukprot:2196041-Prymnesium_polylepis.3
MRQRVAHATARWAERTGCRARSREEQKNATADGAAYKSKSSRRAENPTALPRDYADGHGAWGMERQKSDF